MRFVMTDDTTINAENEAYESTYIAGLKDEDGLEDEYGYTDEENTRIHEEEEAGLEEDEAVKEAKEEAVDSLNEKTTKYNQLVRSRIRGSSNFEELAKPTQPNRDMEYILMNREGFVTRLIQPDGVADLEIQANIHILGWATKGDAKLPYFVFYGLFCIPSKKLIENWDDGDSINHILDDEDCLEWLNNYSVKIETPDVICEKEPESDHEHDWDLITKFAHGEGTVTREICRDASCILERITDTNAEDPMFGVDGYTTVEYKESE